MDAMIKAISDTLLSAGSLGAVVLLLCILNGYLLKRLFALIDKMFDCINHNTKAFERLIEKLDGRPCLYEREKKNDD